MGSGGLSLEKGLSVAGGQDTHTQEMLAIRSWDERNWKPDYKGIGDT